jgi:hypothetical protein
MKEGLRFNIANIQSSFVLDRDNFALRKEVKRNILPVLGYSCQNWSHHLFLTRPAASDALPGTLLEFLELRALFWIEAMNLLGSRGRCDPMLRMALQWVVKLEVSIIVTE